MTAMSKKKRQQQQEKPEEPLGENWTNPFKDLNSSSKNRIRHRRHPPSRRSSRNIPPSPRKTAPSSPPLERKTMTRRRLAVRTRRKNGLCSPSPMNAKGAAARPSRSSKAWKGSRRWSKWSYATASRLPSASAGVSWTGRWSFRATNANEPPSGWKETSSGQKSADGAS